MYENIYDILLTTKAYILLTIFLIVITIGFIIQILIYPIFFINKKFYRILTCYLLICTLRLPRLLRRSQRFRLKCSSTAAGENQADFFETWGATQIFSDYFDAVLTNMLRRVTECSKYRKQLLSRFL